MSEIDLDAIKAAVNGAHKHVGALCTGEARWKMTIPVDPQRDSDLIITTALCNADQLIDEVKRLRAELAQTSAAHAVVTSALDKSGEYGRWAEREIARLEAELELLRPVVEAAKALVAAYNGYGSFQARVRDPLHALALAVGAADALAAAERSTAEDGATDKDPWAANDVYTVPCPTCGRMASAYCVNFQGREVYPAHAARYQRLTEPMDVPIEAASGAGQASGEEAGT